MNKNSIIALLSAALIFSITLGTFTYSQLLNATSRLEHTSHVAEYCNHELNTLTNTDLNT